MLKSCSYCGGLHSRGETCPKKPVRQKKNTHIDKFRWSKTWQKKRKQINDRDKYLCQACIRDMKGTELRYNYTDIEVHHIVPMIEDWDKRLEDTNLICLCSTHHSMAERGEITREQLEEIVEEIYRNI